MGIQHLGAFGGFVNKTGALVGHRTGGQNVITAIPHPSNKPPTTAQLNQRAKFRLLGSFLRRMTVLIRVGFEESRLQKQSAFSAAFKENYYNAITGVAPNFTINYPMLVYSKGILSGPYTASALAVAGSKIEVTWTAQIATGVGEATDKITVVAYNPAKKQFAMLAGAALRSALTFNLQVPPDWAGDGCHVWASMVSTDGKKASDSQYLGLHTIL
ncbi:DUF6266 family protein [Pedobacter africanus]|uniref:Uncharacterized protein n=1 Tax=Pedobacter africanus TaxID=151894 RepID=A0A1W2CUI7_9SPHI|nr:DUF6266 family protein [Pedobacter africanus]SMC88897.1 hypothetical protein SAMN04488524_3256 [Pedobacter africanus]